MITKTKIEFYMNFVTMKSKQHYVSIDKNHDFILIAKYEKFNGKDLSTW